MPQITTNAIVLRRADYRENDRMITLFSPTLGRIDALCRGCRRQKSPLMAASELFCAGEYVLYASRERTTVVSCQVTDTYYALRSDYEKLSHGCMRWNCARRRCSPIRRMSGCFCYCCVRSPICAIAMYRPGA